MVMWTVWAVVALAIGGIAAWTLRHKPNASATLGAAGCLAAAVFGLHAAVNCLLHPQIERIRLPWNLPYASFTIGLDPLSAFFLLPLFTIGVLVAIHALKRPPGDYATNRPHEYWLFLNLTLAGAALAVIARNAVLFLAAWELMTLASFLLIENDQREPGGKSGGWVYLSAGHIGCAALIAMFALVAPDHNALDFSRLVVTDASASIAFVLACVGFGGKIGLAPMQTWYPEAYPPAPAHVGAILSGVVGNLGVYGLLRMIAILGDGRQPPAWWGYLLLFAGVASALAGAARALASRDLSRLLAWSSVENYGLMAAGIGIGLLGATLGNGLVSHLGFCAAIFHMLNHAVSKALLFLCAGSLYARTGTRNLDRMGGLLKRLPKTGFLFLVGALGAAAVPPLNGFAGEFLLLFAAFNGAAGYNPASLPAASMFAAIVVIAVAGGLAVAAYLKAFGFIFLGNPRGPGAASRHGEDAGWLAPHMALAAAAAGLAAASPWVLSVVGPTARALVVPLQRSDAAWDFVKEIPGTGWLEPLGSLFFGFCLLAGCLVVAFAVRWIVMRGKKTPEGPTWDCGYATPDARMQYTASSFARPIAKTFQALTNVRDNETKTMGYFPAGASFASQTPEIGEAWGFSHAFKLIARAAARVRVMQSGQVQIYLLYMAVALVILLVWKL